MKCEIIISNEETERVVIYTREKNDLVKEIERLIENQPTSLIGYKENVAQVLNPSDVCYFTVENNKVCAVTHQERFAVKLRIYQLEEVLKKDFIKINQSCIANVREIEKFDFSVWGSIKVAFKNGDVDYVSRRNIKSIKERLGI